ncbi:Nif3-like dinuclear metal center hexameric protein [Salinispirillum sp. LH 10-3-1]|uniref:GTP cyclohydrolase 1 type 2 homolog n=1 Tax=Salinispirillum sp. LH 10-3-1 TaxID=2952525 RepID=A0AB38YCU3_9GAMM
MAVAIGQLNQWFNELLEPQAFQDYCPNGLQVEGARPVQKLVLGVTASQLLLDQAIAAGADAVLVHHGYFWKGEDACITGMKRRRIQALLEAGVSLWAYHLPLDAHPTLGNNAQLAARMGWQAEAGIKPGPRPIGNIGSPREPLSAQQLKQQLATELDYEPLHIAGGPEQITRVAWCTGGAQGMIQAAWEAGADAYISGEISEPTVHAARELGIHYFAAGHHATERYGVQAVGAEAAKTWGIDVEFIDCPIPV